MYNLVSKTLLVIEFLWVLTWKGITLEVMLSLTLSPSCNMAPMLADSTWSERGGLITEEDSEQSSQVSLNMGKSVYL